MRYKEIKDTILDAQMHLISNNLKEIFIIQKNENGKITFCDLKTINHIENNMQKRIYKILGTIYKNNFTNGTVLQFYTKRASAFLL